MSYSVEKSVKMPTSIKNRGVKTVYPFRQMEIGDSFLVTDKPLSTVKGAVYGHNLRYRDTKFSVRVTPEGARVWRIG